MQPSFKANSSISGVIWSTISVTRLPNRANRSLARLASSVGSSVKSSSSTSAKGSTSSLSSSPSFSTTKHVSIHSCGTNVARATENRQLATRPTQDLLDMLDRRVCNFKVSSEALCPPRSSFPARALPNKSE